MPKNDREFEGFTKVKGDCLESECERCGRKLPYVHIVDADIRILCAKCERKKREEMERDEMYDDFDDEDYENELD